MCYRCARLGGLSLSLGEMGLASYLHRLGAMRKQEHQVPDHVMFSDSRTTGPSSLAGVRWDEKNLERGLTRVSSELS